MTVQTSYVPLRGGIDLVTPATLLDPGAAILAINYECPLEGGYASVPGYTRLGTGVPGQGEILGVAVWVGVPYAIRQTTGVSTCSLWKWDGSTWTEVGTGLPRGRYEMREGNLYATAATESLFMVCPNGKPWKYDGTNLTELTNAPSGAAYLVVHRNHLFLGFEAGSVQFSATGDPADWTALSGAGEVGTQDKVTGLAIATGGVLIIFGRDSIQALYGSSSADFELRSIAANSGAKAYSVVEMTMPMFVNERGITSLEAVQAFGDFQQSDLSRKIQPLFSAGFQPQCATISKAKSQYRVWDTTGRGIRITLNGSQNIGITITDFPVKPEVAATGETIAGDEVSVFGDEDGNVYQLDTGTSFNGTAIESILVLPYHHCKSPTVRKRFRRAYLETTGLDATQFSVLPELDYGDEGIARHRRMFVDVMASGGRWGIANWDEFAWSAPYQSNTPISLEGTGENINLAVYHSSDSVKPHSIKGYHLHFTPRRLKRG